MSVDLGEGWLLLPSDYCLRHGHNTSDCRLRSWNFEGSIDGSSYTVLKTHRNDNSLAKQGFSVAAWKLPAGELPEIKGLGWVDVDEGERRIKIKQAYRHFRIRLAGEQPQITVNGEFQTQNSLHCAGIELYGILLRK
jgi:hypothetical protein